MKQQLHSLTIVTFILVISSLTSCKKYNCECSAHNLYSPDSFGQSGYTVKKKDRAKRCTDLSTQPDSNGDYRTCIIK